MATFKNIIFYGTDDYYNTPAYSKENKPYISLK
jgi:hypothetical protein